MKQLLLALAAGAAAVLAFAPIAFYPLGVGCLALLAALWLRSPPGYSFWLGFAFGMGLFGAGVSWVFVSLSVYGGMPAPLAAFATLCFCALLSLFPAAAGWLQARIPAGDAARAAIVIPAAWTLLEWLRSWALTGFPWLSMGYAAAGWPTQGLAPLGGVFAASLATAVLAGLVCLFFLRPDRRWPAAAAIVALVGGAQGLRAVEWTEPSGAPVTVSLLQGNIAQELKFRPERYERIVQTYLRLAEESRARLIVLPETAIPRLLDRIEPSQIARLRQAALDNGGDLLLGAATRDDRGDYYNSVVSLGKAAQQAYHKQHLVPFGEFVPPAFGWVMRWLSIPMSDFSSGPADQPPLAVAGQRVAVNVCYEDAFGDQIARQARRATLLVNASNVAWFGDSLAPPQHLQIARLRAIETARMVLTATNSGVTAAIDRDGTVLARLPQFAEGRLDIAVRGYAGGTPYMRFGDPPIVLLSLIVLAAAVSWARFAKRSR